MIRQAEFLKGPAEAVDELADNVIGWILGSGKDGAVLGLSGGVDSSTVALICDQAFRERVKKRREQKVDEEQLQLHLVIMTSSANDPSDAEDAKLVANRIRIRNHHTTVHEVVIDDIVDAFIPKLPQCYQNGNREDNYHIGSLFSEIRAVVLSRYAATLNCLVMGTGNFDEDYALGYFNKRGDGAVDNNVLGMLPKYLVRELATWFGMPEKISQRVATAGLRQGQTDEKELAELFNWPGFTYRKANMIIRGHMENRETDEIAVFTGIDSVIVRNVVRHHLSVAHKSDPPPIGKLSLAFKVKS